MALPFQSSGSLYCPAYSALPYPCYGWSWPSLCRLMIVWGGEVPCVFSASLRLGSGQIYVVEVLKALKVAMIQARSHLGKILHCPRRCQSLLPDTRHVCLLSVFSRVAALIRRNGGERTAWEPWLVCIRRWGRIKGFSTDIRGHGSLYRIVDRLTDLGKWTVWVDNMEDRPIKTDAWRTLALALDILR